MLLSKIISLSTSLHSVQHFKVNSQLEMYVLLLLLLHVTFLFALKKEQVRVREAAKMRLNA